MQAGRQGRLYSGSVLRFHIMTSPLSPPAAKRPPSGATRMQLMEPFMPVSSDSNSTVGSPSFVKET